MSPSDERRHVECDAPPAPEHVELRSYLIRTSDGLELTAFAGSASGTTHTLLLANAYGIRARIAWRLARELRRFGIRFVTWETRGTPGPGEEVERYTPEVHAGDLVKVIDALELEALSVLGWCSGAEVALHAAVLRPKAVQELILANGYYSLRKRAPTRDGSALEALMRAAAASTQAAALTYQLCVAGTARSLFGACSDPMLAKEVAAPLVQDAATMSRYARMLVRLYEGDVAAVAKKVQTRTAVLAGEGDKIASPGDSESLAQLLPNATYTVAPHAGHYALFSDPQSADEIAAIVRSVPTERRAELSKTAPQRAR